jgi:hypothetical protein
MDRNERLLKETVKKNAGIKIKKGGVLTFVGELSKILCGPLDEGNSKYCN